MPICDAAGRAHLGAGFYTGAARTHREERYWQRSWRIYKTRPQHVGSEEATLGHRIPWQRKESSSRPPSAGRPGAAYNASVFNFNYVYIFLWDTFIQKILFQIMKISNCRGNVTDISAIPDPLAAEPSSRPPSAGRPGAAYNASVFKNK